MIVEASEMVGLNRKEIEELKADISRTDDGGVRLTYREDPNPLPRRFVMAGTTNNAECLPNDPSGNRRFVVVETTKGNPTEIRNYLDENREQLWAEALVRVLQDKETAYLPHELHEAQSSRNDEHRTTNEVLETAIDTYLSLPTTRVEYPDGVQVAAIMAYLRGRDIPHVYSKQVGGYLQVLGFEKKRKKEKREDGTITKKSLWLWPE